MSKLTRLLAFSALASFTLLASSPDAGATLIVSGSVGGAPVGATNYVNFDALALGNGGGVSGGITVSFTGDAQTVIGSLGGKYAAPFLSSGNGAMFGTPDGADSTRYLSTGIGTVTMLMPGPMRYLGLLWGSVDGYNALEFFSGAASVGIVTGSDVVASPNGDQGVNGTLYVEVSSDTAFDRVVARSTSYAFEFDNVAFFTGPSPGLDPVPAPATLGLLGAALAGLGVARRRAA